MLAPTDDIVRDDGRCRVSANDSSLVLRVRSGGRTLLLTGDIEARSEAELVATYGERLRADVLKAPHHGSRTSSTEAFLDAVRPSLVLVSGEPDNPPWPPHPAILERYRERGYDVRGARQRRSHRRAWARRCGGDRGGVRASEVRLDR
ncbi:MAG: hypothetical protein U1F43_15360 [Myxococcota bacterium]